MWFLLGEREEPPGELANGTANHPTQRALLSPQVQVILSVCGEQIEQVVFRVGNLLILREIVEAATIQEAILMNFLENLKRFVRNMVLKSCL